MNEHVFLQDCVSCGARPRSTSWWYDHLHEKYMVSCFKCGTNGDWHKAPEDAATAWNARQEVNMDKPGGYLRDDKGAIVHCPLCKGAVLITLCVEGEFSCSDTDRKHACEGWSDACCECGYAYGQCQT